MPPAILTERLSFRPVVGSDESSICAMLWAPDVRRQLSDGALVARETVRAEIAESLDPASITSFWIISGQTGENIGLAGLRPPTTSALRLRAIGWRSLELFVALEPRFWGKGYASEAVDAVAAHAGRDGVTFALVASVDEPNQRAHRLMQQCRFHVLGHAAGPVHPKIVYERAV